MGNLYSVLNSASQSLQAFERAIDVTQNNVTNANSPGYADQVPQLISQDFESNTGVNVGRRSGGHPGHPQHLRRHGRAAAIVAAGHVSAAANYARAAADRFRRFFQQPHSLGAESVVPKLFAMEHAAGQRELPVGRASTRPSKPLARSSKPPSSSVKSRPPPPTIFSPPSPRSIRMPPPSRLTTQTSRSNRSPTRA